jgi:hypothetical protein
MISAATSESSDVVLIGAGITSAMLGTVLMEFEPTLDVVMLETLDDCAAEIHGLGDVTKAEGLRDEARDVRWPCSLARRHS